MEERRAREEAQQRCEFITVGRMARRQKQEDERRKKAKTTLKQGRPALLPSMSSANRRQVG
jgi:hypothetical protein